ncbi:MAG: hypothetical protein JXB07_11595 [Anaerolineae bacterium]|nr:hypothetical protein [Anaerolineae bacterium]
MLKLATRHTLLLSVVSAAIIAAILTADFWNYTQDDVFITYTYSRNIAQGRGFVFNPGERVQGTTTPLYTLLMSGVYLITPDLLHAGNLLSTIFLVLACGLVVSLMRSELSAYSRFAIAVMLATLPLVYVSFGMETLLYCALLMLAFRLWGQGHRRWAMLAAAALTWTRADGIVLGGVLWLVAAWEAWRDNTERPIPARVSRFPWVLGLIYMAGILPWFGFAWVYFGTPLPNTLSAKQEILQGVRFWVDGFGWWKTFYGNNPLSALSFPLIGLGIWESMRRPRLRPLALWAIAFTAGYTVLNVTAFWYYTPLVVVLIVLAAIGGECIARWLLHRRLQRGMVVGVSLFLVCVSGALAFAAAWPYGTPPPRTSTYRLVGQWIEQNTDPDSTILVGDLGIMGYYAQRRTLDTPGLVVPRLPHWQDGYTIANYRPDYIVATQYYAWVDLISQDWFVYQYVPVAQISTPGDIMSPITLYHQRLPLAMPAQVIQGLDLPLTCPVDLEQGERLPKETRARLLSPAEEMVVEASHPFLLAQYPGDQAAQPEKLFEQIALPLAVAPGDYRWEMDCIETLHGEVEVLAVEQADGYAPISGADWADFARLAGIAFPHGNEIWSGGTLTVMLKWETLKTPSLDYSLFLHLRDADGQIVAQADGYPRNGSRPTTSWEADETIVDVWPVGIPSTVPAGDYQLFVGWYDWRSGDRLALSDGRDAVELPIVIHNKWPGGSGLP